MKQVLGLSFEAIDQLLDFVHVFLAVQIFLLHYLLLEQLKLLATVRCYDHFRHCVWDILDIRLLCQLSRHVLEFKLVAHLHLNGFQLVLLQSVELDKVSHSLPDNALNVHPLRRRAKGLLQWQKKLLRLVWIVILGIVIACELLLDVDVVVLFGEPLLAICPVLPWQVVVNI